MPSFSFEQEAAGLGYRAVAGVDEAGRGPLAGPVVAAAVIFLEPSLPDALAGIDDSKRLTAPEREDFFEGIIRCPHIAWAVAVVGVHVIDRINILQATRRAMEQALANLPHVPDFALLDGLPFRTFSCPHRGIVQGDSHSCSIAAASIVAKVTRDRLMDQCHARFPRYGFNRHRGYGTPEHLVALGDIGPCPEHRRSFRPVAEALAPRLF